MTETEKLSVIDRIKSLPRFLVHHKTYKNPFVDDRTQPDEQVECGFEEANLISSIAWDDGDEVLHRPMLDIDMAVRITQSSTPGNFHVAIDKLLTTEDYDKLLTVLNEVGLIGDGIIDNQWKKRGATFLRPPWNKKTPASGGSAMEAPPFSISLISPDEQVHVFTGDAGILLAHDKLDEGYRFVLPEPHYQAQSNTHRWILWPGAGYVTSNETSMEFQKKQVNAYCIDQFQKLYEQTVQKMGAVPIKSSSFTIKLKDTDGNIHEFSGGGKEAAEALHAHRFLKWEIVLPTGMYEAVTSTFNYGMCDGSILEVSAKIETPGHVQAVYDYNIEVLEMLAGSEVVADLSDFVPANPFTSESKTFAGEPIFWTGGEPGHVAVASGDPDEDYKQVLDYLPLLEDNSGEKGMDEMW